MLFLLVINIVFVAATCLQPPTIDIQVFSVSSMQLSCSFNFSIVNVTNFQRNDSLLVKQMIKVDNNAECKVTTALPSEHVKCDCLDNIRVVCNISYYNLTNISDQWRCSVFGYAFSEYIHSEFGHASFRGITPSTEEIITEVSGRTVIHEEESMETIETTKSIAESCSITTVKNINATTDDTLRSSSASNFNVVAILATAGPFILLDIGLILCVYRKKLKECRNRKVGRVASVVTVNFNGGSVSFQQANVAAGCGDAAFVDGLSTSNLNTHCTSTAPMEQLSCESIDVDDDDQSYSRARHNDAIRPNESVCGVNAHGTTQCIDSFVINQHLNPACDIVDDPTYTTVSSDPLHKRGLDNGLMCLNKHTTPGDAHKAYESNPFNSSGNDDPLYSVIKRNTTPLQESPIQNHFDDHDSNPLFKTVIRENQPSVSLKNKSLLNTSIKNDDNAVENTDSTLYTTVNEIKTLSSKEKKKNPHNLPLQKQDRTDINVAQTESLDENKGKEDPLYSTVCKDRKRGANDTDWNSKVNKKKVIERE